jgi:hypothetical protein
MDKFTQYTGVMSFFLGFVALEMILMNSFWMFIDMTSLIIMVGMFIVGYYHYKHQIESFAIGAGIFGFLIGFVAIFANLSDPNDLGPAMHVAMLPIIYAVIGIYFIHNTILIYQDENEYDSEEYEMDTNNMSLLVSVFMITSLTILLTGAGFGAYMDVPSMIIALGIFSAFFVKNNYKRLLLMKNYMIGQGYAIPLISTALLLSKQFEPEIIGPVVAIMVLNIIYMYIIYFVYLKKQLHQNKISTLKIDIALAVTGVYSLIIPLSIFLTLNVFG